MTIVSNISSTVHSTGTDDSCFFFPSLSQNKAMETERENQKLIGLKDKLADFFRAHEIPTIDSDPKEDEDI